MLRTIKAIGDEEKHFIILLLFLLLLVLGNEENHYINGGDYPAIINLLYAP